MRVLDVNVLMYAFWTGAEQHVETREWLVRESMGVRPMLVPGVVLSGFVRITTGSRALEIPEPLDNALAFCDWLLAQSAVRIIHPGETHWNTFVDLCRRTKATGNLVPDAYIAAMAIERGAEMTSFDNDYRVFPSLTWGHPLGLHPFTNPT